ncbi:hypothetical protein BZA02_105221 [Ruegeria sp. P4]|nr:hypothetical protein BZA02_105221 [Ruegeria sp. P4]
MVTANLDAMVFEVLRCAMRIAVARAPCPLGTAPAGPNALCGPGRGHRKGAGAIPSCISQTRRITNQNKKAPDLVYPARFAGYASDLTGHEYRDFQMEGGAVGSGEWGGLRPLVTFISNKT